MRRFLGLGLIILFTLVVFAFVRYYPQLEVISSYSAKIACTCHFAGNRSVSNISKHELGYSPIKLAKIHIDKSQKSATANVLGMKSKTATYRKGLGCVLLHGEDDYKISYPENPRTEVEFKWSTSSSNNQELKKHVRKILQDSIAKHRSILIIKSDSIVAEEYSEGLNKDTPQIGWSMTKSITNALVGIATGRGILNLNSPNVFKAWKKDDRSQITLQHLLQMNSGLKWEEDYTTISDATEMLFLSEDVVNVAMDNPLEFKPTEHWEYSSGSSNLLMGALREKLGNEAYWTFPRTNLFEPLGMSSAFIEIDESGNFIGSSYGYASARDWAKFGRLYLYDGVSPSGLKILPRDWVKFSTQPVNRKTKKYGAQWYLNYDNCQFKDVPADMYYASGFQGQHIFIIPSEDLIIVRLGVKKLENINQFIYSILEKLAAKN